MKKGFTLIELLAVIVILAIIALIATPIILNIIGNAKDESNERSKELYLRAVNQAIATRNLTEEFNPSECTVQKDGNLKCGDKDLLVEVSGTKPCSGTIIFDKDGKISNETLSYCNENDVQGDVSGSDDENTNINVANAPNLMDTLTPVKYENNNWVITTSDDSSWYNYESQEWANAVILSESGNTKNVGDPLTLPTSPDDIASSDVLAMFVWIPRYSYTISESAKGEKQTCTYHSEDSEVEFDCYKNPGAIDIKFVDETVTESGSATYVDNSDKESSWYTHPAFKFDEKQLSGIWVGKFETSDSEGTGVVTLSCKNTSCSYGNNIRILPNVISRRNKNLSNFFFASRSMSNLSDNIFGMVSTKTASHMMRGNEWGAVAYLSQSKYGKYGNGNYEGANKEVYKNNSSSYYTGRSSGKPNGGSLDEGTCKYDEVGTSRQNGTGDCGPGASTTGNITGVYDMNGGALEYVALTRGTYSNTSSSGFSATSLRRILYEGYIERVVTTSRGRALLETSGWYSDHIYEHDSKSTYPFLLRGNGLFGYEFYVGIAQEMISYRIVLF